MTGAVSQLLKFGVFGFGFLEGDEIRVGVLPGGEEVLVGGAGFRRISLQGVGASEAELGNTKGWRSGEEVGALDYLAKFESGVCAIFFVQIDETADIRNERRRDSGADA